VSRNLISARSESSSGDDKRLRQTASKIAAAILTLHLRAGVIFRLHIPSFLPENWAGTG
jgi:hypothetical protein